MRNILKWYHEQLVQPLTFELFNITATSAATNERWTRYITSINNYWDNCWQYSEWEYSSTRYVAKDSDWYTYAPWFSYTDSTKTTCLACLCKFTESGVIQGYYQCIDLWTDFLDSTWAAIKQVFFSWNTSWIESLWYTDLTEFMNYFISTSWTYTSLV